MTNKEKIKELEKHIKALEERVLALEARPQLSYTAPAIYPVQHPDTYIIATTEAK